MANTPRIGVPATITVFSNAPPITAPNRLTPSAGAGFETSRKLREKLALPELEVVPGGNGARRAVLVEVKGALLNLGYTPAEARSALESLPEADDSSVEDMLKRALKELVR